MKFFSHVGYLDTSNNYHKVLTLNDNGWYLSPSKAIRTSIFNSVNNELIMRDRENNELITINSTAITLHSTNFSVDLLTCNGVSINSISSLDNFQTNKPIQIKDVKIDSINNATIIENTNTGYWDPILITLNNVSLSTPSITLTNSPNLSISTINTTNVRFKSVTVR